MSKKLNTSKRKRPIKISSTVVTSITVAIIGCVGTASAALVGYLGTRYQSDALVQHIVASPTIYYTVPLPSPTSSVEPITSLSVKTGWMPCNSSIAYVLPDNINPEEHSYNTLIQKSDLSKMDKASLDSTFPTVISLVNTTTSGNWLKVNNNIQIHLELISPKIESHVNLFILENGCGGEEYKQFSSAFLSQDNRLEKQTLISSDYDFFSIQPGEFDEYEINFICMEPGVYQASGSLSIDILQKNSVEFSTTTFEKMICPKEYSLWKRTIMMEDSEPLKFEGDYYWDGEKYIMKP